MKVGRLFGWAAQEMLGRPMAHRLPPEARAEVAAMIRTIAAGQEFAGEWHDYRKDGSRVWIDARVAFLRDRAGTPIGFIGLAHDITERKKIEEALRRNAEA